MLATVLLLTVLGVRAAALANPFPAPAVMPPGWAAGGGGGVAHPPPPRTSIGRANDLMYSITAACPRIERFQQPTRSAERESAPQHMTTTEGR